MNKTQALQTHNVLNRIIERIKEKNHTKDPLDIEYVEFKLRLDGTCVICEDISGLQDYKILEHFDTINDFINWLEE